MFAGNIILIIHVSECVGGGATALRTFTMLRTERDGFAVEFGLQIIVNVRNEVAPQPMHEEQVYY